MNGRQVNTSVVIPTVSLSFCLLILCRHMSQDEIRVHGKPSLDVSTMVKSGTLPRRHQMVECFARKGDETTFVNIERLPVLAMQQLSPASATYSSVVDAFVIRQSQVSSDAAQVASDMNDVMQVEQSGRQMV